MWPDGPSLITTTDTSGTHRTQTGNSPLCFFERRAKTVVREQLGPPEGSYRAPSLGATMVHTGSNRKGTAHTHSPWLKKKKKNEGKHLGRARRRSCLGLRGTQSSNAPAAAKWLHMAGGSVQINIPASLRTRTTNRRGPLAASTCLRAQRRLCWVRNAPKKTHRQKQVRITYICCSSRNTKILFGSLYARQ